MNLLGKKKIFWLGFSGVLLALAIISLAVWRLRLGLDFAGGSVLEISKLTMSKDETTKRLAELNLENLTVTQAGQGGALIKTKPIDEAKKKEILEKLGGDEARFETVGPTVSKDLIKKSLLAVAVASAAIVFYLAYAFRKTGDTVSSWRFGGTAIVALIHDLVITIGGFSLAGHFLGYEVDGLFITALLTVLGFSVHDTIVVFDRIRENLKLHPEADFEQIVNASLVQTIARSLNTSLTVILVLLAMYLLGGQTIKPFVFALLLGITVGTYSSIFVAAPLLVFWQARKRKS